MFCRRGTGYSATAGMQSESKFLISVHHGRQAEVRNCYFENSVATAITICWKW